MARSGNKGCDILPTGDAEIPVDNAGKTKYNGLTATLKLLNNISYNKLILAREDKICFLIMEESKTKENKYGDTRQAWIGLR